MRGREGVQAAREMIARVDRICAGLLRQTRGSFPRRKAEVWWRERSNAPCPDTVQEAIELAESGALAPCKAIRIGRNKGDQYDRVTWHDLGPIPDYVPAPAPVRTIPEVPDDGIPF